MTLAGAFVDYEGALRASLQTAYGMRLLRDGRTEPQRTLTELADYVAHLPHGCALWVEMGGELALTDEAHLLREAVYRLEVLSYQQAQGKGPEPKRIPLPRPAAEQRAEYREQQGRMAAKARRHAGRGRKQSQTT